MLGLRTLALAVTVTFAVHAAEAAVVKADISGAAGVQSQALPPLGTGQFVPAVTIFAGETFEGTISAPLDLFNTGVSLSTLVDSDPFNLSFGAPIFGLQFSGGITDEFGGFLSGIATLTVDGMSLDYDLDGSGPQDIGALSTTAFSSAMLSLTSFDVSASAIAFLDADAILVTNVNPIPLPSSAVMLLSVLAFGVMTARRRQAVS